MAVAVKLAGGQDDEAKSGVPAGDPGSACDVGNGVTSGGVAALETAADPKAEPVVACLLCICHAMWHRRENDRLHAEHLNGCMVLCEENNGCR